MTIDMTQMYVVAWGVLVVGLSLSTFGLFWSCMFIVYAILFVVGFLCVLGYFGYAKSVERVHKTATSSLELAEQGLDRILKEVWKSSQKSYKMDKRLTGSSIIDEPLQEVLQFFFRDYVHKWYYTISNDEEFLYDLRQTLQRALIAFANRSKDVEWVTFLTTRFVDDITNHLKIYRLAKERLDKAIKAEGEETSETIEKYFFEVESEMEGGICREKICLSEKSEKEYLCDISEMLLYLLLPQEDFHNKPFRYLFRELIAMCVLLPSVKTVCDPDYINQTVVWLCKESTFTREAFLTVISEGLDSVDDVEAVRDKVDVEIAKLRAHDSESTDAADAAVRQQLSSLLFVHKLCEAKIRLLKYGGELPPVAPENQVEPDQLFVPNQPVPILPLQVILDNNTALSYFIEFMTSVNGQVYLYFWLAVEGYRVTAEQQLSVRKEKQLSFENSDKGHSPSLSRQSSTSSGLCDLRGAAKCIFDQYLSEQADPRVSVSKDLLKKTQKRVNHEEPSAECFDDAQSVVYEQLGQDQFYGSFLNSQAYMRCLLDLDILKEKSDDGDSVSLADDDFETRSLPDSLSGYSDSQEDIGAGDKRWTSDDDLRLTANISEIGWCKDGGKSYTVYTISVFRATQEGTHSWIVYRRYSDFDDLHMRIKDKFGPIPVLLLPGKRTFRNMDKEFLEKRRSALDAYLQNVLMTELLEKHPGLFEIVANFLEHGKYAREKGHFARKVHNLRHSVHNVSHAIKTVPLGLSGGVHKMFKPDREVKDDSKQVPADVDFEEDDNIALRVLLLLMDEIFDLKDRNLWLRRRIIVLLRQIIKTTYGDRINRKIVESVNDLTSAEQIAEYVKMFRDSFWPGGVLSEPRTERNFDVKIRTRVAGRTKMYGSIPEDLSRFLGADVTMDGVCRVFDTFQNSSFNKRLLYVLAEGILEQLFPDNKFSDIFRKIHARSST